VVRVGGVSEGLTTGAAQGAVGVAVFADFCRVFAGPPNWIEVGQYY
jgi:hypothetical protein